MTDNLNDKLNENLLRMFSTSNKCESLPHGHIPLSFLLPENAVCCGWKEIENQIHLCIISYLKDFSNWFLRKLMCLMKIAI